jgi:hypothetical protein
MIAALFLALTPVMTQPVANEATHSEFDLDSTLDISRSNARGSFQALPSEFQIMGRLEIYENHPVGIGGLLAPCQRIQRQQALTAEMNALGSEREWERRADGDMIISPGSEGWEIWRGEIAAGRIGWGLQVDQMSEPDLISSDQSGECRWYRARRSEHPKEITSSALGRITLIEVIEP